MAKQVKFEKFNLTNPWDVQTHLQLLVNHGWKIKSVSVVADGAYVCAERDARKGDTQKKNKSLLKGLADEINKLGPTRAD